MNIPDIEKLRGYCSFEDQLFVEFHGGDLLQYKDAKDLYDAALFWRNKHDKLITENTKLKSDFQQIRQEIRRTYETNTTAKDLINRLINTSIDMATEQATHDHLMARRDAVEFIEK